MARRRIKGSGSSRISSKKRLNIGSVKSSGTTGSISRAPMTMTTSKSRLTAPVHKGIKMPGIQARDISGPSY